MNTAVVLNEKQAKQIREWLCNNGQQLIADVCLMMQGGVLRVSTALSLTFADVVNGEIDVTESKTGKRKALILPGAVVEMVARRRAEFPEDEHLFRSQRNRFLKKQKPVSREEVSKQISIAAKEIGINGTVSAHSFRKCAGNTVYRNSGNNIALAMKVLNHSSAQSTLSYLQLDKQAISNALEGMDL
ncbi:tyrosine-type recombinase/integrase [Leclercia adecarboxylata]|uniref:tyrosine-type recombinase/integrase n=1 Tax=Leclercia adecarboxylata TaxID=83655 RepID=UPI0029491329|nr:tyrosine-type recombinase/integrase [Leclercia adecarboxylata]MDV5238147.1 tyrosine-type recombinase/integrase [Leclercia adecarboxylata]MDV5279010.1 tyrosine-type recombinase/integrase [Leclercia adecarboxylata]MDV5462730.1 tyrosine-type recombinase/integrase [Leclercia adecarboxylata]MDV5502122.1 tyrosine-type recombinase/integrase [Leclercia adecarboxylata]MDV5534448.1 tyrosine-type recombinase/integrase [Leclercia adecarboxylata]